MYCLSLIQPHATLLCWGAIAGSHHILQTALFRPTWASLLGMPPILRPPSEAPSSSKNIVPSSVELSATTEGASKDGKALRDASVISGGASLAAPIIGVDAELMMFLGQRYARMRRTEAAASCYRMALDLDKDNKEAREQLDSLTNS